MTRLFASAILMVISFLTMASEVVTDADRARDTLYRMRAVRTAVEGYAGAHNAWPRAKSMEELRDLVQPQFVKMLPMRDSWGTPFIYELDSNVGYRLVSAGADREFDRKTWSTGGQTTSFNDDAVANGDRAGFFRAWELK